MQDNSFLTRLVHPLDAWLWRRGFQNPLVRQMLKSQIIFVLLAAVLGCVALPWTAHGLTFALGVIIFAHIFWGISGQVLGFSLTTYSRGLLFLLLIRSALRLVITAVVLYVAFVVFNASAIVLVCGVIASMALALGTFACIHFQRA